LPYGLAPRFEQHFSRWKGEVVPAARAEATGIMPKDVLLDEMRWHYGEFERI